MERPSLSVIIPTFRRPLLVLETVRAALEQLADGDEVLVCDDGSGDETPQVLASIDDPRLIVLSQPNRGAAAARNHALGRATAAVVVFIDDDEPPQPGCLDVHRARHAAADAPLVVMGGRDLVVPHRSGTRIVPGGPPNVDRPLVANEGSWSVPRRVLDRVGHFDEALRRGQEVELLLRLRRDGIEIAAAPEARTRHHLDRGFREFASQRRAGGRASAAIRRRHGIGMVTRCHDMTPVPRALCWLALRSPVLELVLAGGLWGVVRLGGWVGVWRMQTLGAALVGTMIAGAAQERELARE